mmetsp:Transcript_21191/g.30727  ORF Transcript_21191/g.30727 Transcript_21191/m.30727 type:complete len:218 (+) Transcript_21191:266-919(+)
MCTTARFTCSAARGCVATVREDEALGAAFSAPAAGPSSGTPSSIRAPPGASISAASLARPSSHKASAAYSRATNLRCRSWAGAWPFPPGVVAAAPPPPAPAPAPPAPAPPRGLGAVLSEPERGAVSSSCLAYLRAGTGSCRVRCTQAREARAVMATSSSCAGVSVWAASAAEPDAPPPWCAFSCRFAAEENGRSSGSLRGWSACVHRYSTFLRHLRA